MRKNPQYDLRSGYLLRLLAGLAGSLLIVLCVLRWWPPSTRSVSSTYSTDGRVQVRLRNVQPTRHGREAPPPPPVPIPPVVYPVEERLERIALDVQVYRLTLNRSSSMPASPTGTDAPDAPAKHVQVGPRPVRIVEPTYTEKARSEKVRAAITVKVLVDEKGHVLKASITRRRLLNEKRETTRQVPHLEHGLETAALAAARRWQFRPARQDGEPVESYTTITLRFGI